MARSEIVTEILNERQRQIHEEGWDVEHDYHIHSHGELAMAAACYAAEGYLSVIHNELWPWDMMWWKPKDKRRNLIKAAALIVAEIERLDLVKAREAV